MASNWVWKWVKEPAFFLMACRGRLLWLKKDIQLYRSLWENNTQLPYSMSSVSTFLTSLWVQSLIHEFYFVVILWSNSVVTLWSLLESGRRIKHPFITRLVKSGFKKLMTSKIFCLTLQNLKLFTISLFEFCIPTQKNRNPFQSENLHAGVGTAAFVEATVKLPFPVKSGLKVLALNTCYQAVTGACWSPAKTYKSH